MYRKFGKRLFDLSLVIPALLLLLPLVSILALITRLKIGSPIFFRQRRPGLKGHPFEILKFRTMTDEQNGHGSLLSDADRLVPFGRFLRSSSLDELPELFNVLKGEMSLVGPRPLLIHYLDLYTPEQMKRHNSLPGITGWAQVNGRNAISWDEKFAYDLWYVENLSFWLDCRILIQTFREVARREGINQPGEATMQLFLGSNKQQI